MYFYKYKKYKSKYLNFIGGENVSISKNKLLGSLYGLVIGDALGSRYEFLETDEAIDMVNNDMVGDFLPIKGGGPFDIQKGQATDDSEMMVSLLNTICSGSYSQESAAKSYIKWFDSKPPDMGRTITKSLFTRKRSKNAIDMINNSREMNMTSLSNGLLMRILPLGVLGAIDKSINLKNITSLEADLTHPHNINKAAAHTYCMAVKLTLEGYDKNIVFDKLMLLSKDTPRIRIILNDANNGPEPTYMIDDLKNEIYINTDDKKYQGYLGVALQNTMYEYLHGKSYTSSMINIIKRGGDTDTNCAIAGGLLGALYGINKIDKRWINTVKNANIDRYRKYPYLSPNIIDNCVNKLI